MTIHTAIVPDIRRPLKDGRYPLKLRVTFNRNRRYYSLSHERREGLDFNVTHSPKDKDPAKPPSTDWDKINSTSPRGRHRDLKLVIAKLLNEADSIIRDISPFTFDSFDLAFNGSKKAKTLFGLFEAYIHELRQEGRVSTSLSYNCALNSLKEFDNRADFNNITAHFLSKYESWMADQGRSVTTTGIYLRCLRTIFNTGIRHGVISTTDYPFGKTKDGKYQIPTGANKKKALEIEEIGKILNYRATDGGAKDRARDIWMFSYFSNGMNVKDICSLKIGDVDQAEGVISYIREKTKRTSRTRVKIEVDLIPETLNIIQKWGTLEGDKADYVFPFFYKGITPAQQRRVTQNIVKLTNKYINSICGEVGISTRVNTYHARHSYANILKQSGAPIEFISESLGHTDLATTTSYLKSFTADHRKKWRSKLNPNTP